jgi:hypothetical protein
LTENLFSTDVKCLLSLSLSLSLYQSFSLSLYIYIYIYIYSFFSLMYVECLLYTTGYVHPLDQEEEFEIDSSAQENRMLSVLVTVQCVPNVCLMCAQEKRKLFVVLVTV